MMLAAIGVNFANVVARYVFLRPFPWAEETMQFLAVWLVMLGAAVITRNREHLRMDALLVGVPSRVRRGLEAFNTLSPSPSASTSWSSRRRWFRCSQPPASGASSRAFR